MCRHVCHIKELRHNCWQHEVWTASRESSICFKGRGVCCFASEVQYQYFTVNAPFPLCEWEINFIDILDGFWFGMELFPQASSVILPFPERYQSWQKVATTSIWMSSLVITVSGTQQCLTLQSRGPEFCTPEKYFWKIVITKIIIILSTPVKLLIRWSQTRYWHLLLEEAKYVAWGTLSFEGGSLRNAGHWTMVNCIGRHTDLTALNDRMTSEEPQPQESAVKNTNIAQTRFL